ncbi:MAG: hypothetical protein P2A85_25690 [Microcoleus anatoxicus]
MSANIFVGAKHDRRQFISDRQRFTAVMLRPYTIEMLPTKVFTTNWEEIF